jgi:predicted metal-dependent peptidase
MDQQTELMLKVQRARTRMVITLPFIASAVMMLDIIFDETVPTAETDGNYIYANPQFVSSLSMRQTQWLLAHEALHCVLLHHTRVGSRDFKLWNIAADYVINLILHEMKEFEFIQGCLLDLAYIHMATEEVYNILNAMQQQKKDELKQQHKDAGGFRKAKSGDNKKKEEKQSGTGDGDKEGKKASGKGNEAGKGKDTTMGSGGKKSNSTEKAGAEITGQEEKWQIFSKQSMAIAEKMGGDYQGFGSSCLKRLVEAIVEPVVPWTQYLWIFVDQISRDEYNWNRINKRYVSQGYYFPSLYNEKLGFIVVVIDTSGSISKNDLEKFNSEINSIKGTYNCKVMVIYCDSKVNTEVVETFDEDEEVDLHPYGGGGTDFRPAFRYLEVTELEDQVKCLLYFTDGICSSYPEVPPEYPVLWVGTRKFLPKFGEFVLMESV